MKLKINKILKIALISLLGILILSSSFFLYKEMSNSVFEEQKTPVYNYTNKNLIDYEVFLQPNKLYNSSSLEAGKLYITEYVDYIKANLNYEFKGDSSAKITGDYNIIAKVKGYTGEGEKLVTIWEKDFPIISNKKFNQEGDSFSISERTNIELDEYNAFAKEIIETSKINSQTSLNIIMNVNLKVETDKGPIEETKSSNLVIPLNVSMFEIGGNNNVEETGAIEEIIQVQLPVNKSKVLIFGVIIGILILALIYIIFFTIPTTAKDPLEKGLNKIFKKHGDRLVALNSSLEYFNGDLNIVKSMDDLVRIADEVEKPIFYKYSKDYKEIDKFYITHEDKVYLLDLCELIVKEEDQSSEQLTVNCEQQVIDS